MKDGLVLFGTLAILVLFLWKFYLRPKNQLKKYKLVLEKAGFFVSYFSGFGKKEQSNEESRNVIFERESLSDTQGENMDAILSTLGHNVCLTLVNEKLIKNFCENLKSKTQPHSSGSQIKPLSHTVIQGGLSSVQMDKIIQYVRFLEQLQQNFPVKDSMQKLERLIQFDPVLRLNWEEGIKKSENILPHKTGSDVLALINSVLYTPPSYENCSVIGVPINAILLEFMQTQNGRIFFSHSKVNEIFKQILNDYGEMLRSPVSLKYMNTTSPKGWFSTEAYEKVDYSLYECDYLSPSYGFNCWNDWFLRPFKAGKRPIGAGTPSHIDPQNVIVNACESTPLSYPKQPLRNVQKRDEFWLKDSKYSLSDMLGQRGKKNEYPALFENGTVYQAFLSALCYHHWHAPVDGCIQDIYSIEGTYFLDNSQNLGYFDIESPVDSQAFLSASAARMVMLIKADDPRIGYVGLVFIGMVEVSTCVSVVNIGDRVKKGDALGHFMFGGSSHTVLFQKQLNLTFSDDHYEDGNKGKLQNLSSYLASFE